MSSICTTANYIVAGSHDIVVVAAVAVAVAVVVVVVVVGKIRDTTTEVFALASPKSTIDRCREMAIP
jgi:uncharacterized protein with GYD domain